MTTMLELEEKVFAPPIERRKFRVDEYQKMVQLGILPEESGWEIIAGEIIKKIPIGSKHAGTVKRISEVIRDVIGKAAIISVQDPIHLDDYNEPEPDIALLRRRGDFYTESHPIPMEILVLIEVSDSTVKYDRETKKTLYAEHEIGEFWLVDLTNKTIEIHTQPRRGIYHNIQIFAQDEELESNAVEDLRLNVNEILGL
jgi:Uma2 family endonuclease